MIDNTFKPLEWLTEDELWTLCDRLEAAGEHNHAQTVYREILDKHLPF